MLLLSRSTPYFEVETLCCHARTIETSRRVLPSLVVLVVKHPRCRFTTGKYMALPMAYCAHTQIRADSWSSGVGIWGASGDAGKPTARGSLKRRLSRHVPSRGGNSASLELVKSYHATFGRVDRVISSFPQWHDVPYTSNDPLALWLPRHTTPRPESALSRCRR